MNHWYGNKKRVVVKKRSQVERSFALVITSTREVLLSGQAEASPVHWKQFTASVTPPSVKRDYYSAHSFQEFIVPVGG